MTNPKSRREARRAEGRKFPTYSEFLNLASAPPTQKRIVSPVPSYHFFLLLAEPEEVTLVEVEHPISAPPLYSEFLTEGELLTEAPTLQSHTLAPVSKIPSFSSFIALAVIEVEAETERDLKPKEDFDELVYGTLTEEREETEDKESGSKVGLGLSVAASVVGWGGIVTAVVASREIEVYMFIPGVLAILLAIIGERLSRKSKHQFYVNTVVFSVFVLIFPLILLGIGWLAMSPELSQ